jgi:predicted thioesterase
LEHAILEVQGDVTERHLVRHPAREVPGADPAAYRTSMGVKLGLVGTASLVVADDDTSLALGSGDVPVLGTPRVIALAEEASVQAVADELPAGSTTVGYQVQLTHLAPTPVGGRVTAEATLETVEGRRLTFRASVSDARGLVAAGRITRVVVERARFLERVQNGT